MPRVALVFPPQGHFTQPYLSLPTLVAYLRQQGYDDVHQLDVNIAAYDHILSGERLQLSLERVRARSGFARLDGGDELRFSQLERYQVLSELELSGEALVASIDEAKRVLRTRAEFYDYERYLWAARTVEQALRLFSEEFAPTKLSPHGFVMRHRIERSADILAALDDTAENPFIEYFREHTMPELRALDPDLVGLSLTYPSQAIPALTLAKQLKAWKPNLHITMGGGLLAYIAEKLAKRPELWDLVDSLTVLEGERPLRQLCEVVDGERELADVGNIHYRDAAGKVRATPQQEPLDIKTLPTPDFDGLPLDLYLTPDLVLPIAATRGCYWGKCVFCTLYTVIGPGYRGRTIAQTVEDMRTLRDKYGTRHFYLAIEDLPPDMARALPDAILEAGLDINWWCDARLENNVFTEEVCAKLAASGCRRIAFGYESASDRVLKAMCKGIDPEESLELIRRVFRAGISVTLYTMIGFPTETEEEARSTHRTIMDHQEFIQEVSVRVFYLDDRSEIFKRREEFGIAEVFPDPEADLQVYYDFRTREGMTRADARRVYLDFTSSLRSHFPVFQSTNMLYHELKSHYFLFLAELGGWEELKTRVLDPSTRVGATVPGSHPRRRGDLVRLALRFDRIDVDETHSSIDSALIRPRYQTDLIDERDLARLDGELAALAPTPSVLIYDRRTGETRCLSPDAAMLLDRCDGERSIEEIVEVVPTPHRKEARICLHDIARYGLLEEDPVEALQ